MNGLLTKVKALILLVGANPLIQLLYKAGIGAAGFYYAGNQFAPTKAWAIGLAGAFAGGVVHAFDTWILAQIAAGTPTAPQAPGQNPVQFHVAKLKAMLKMVALILAASAVFASGAMAEGWNAPGKTFGIAPIEPSRMSATLSDTSNGERHLCLLPTETVFGGFGNADIFGKTPSYGLAVGYCMEWANVSASNGQAYLSPILGAGFDVYADVAPLFNVQNPQAPDVDLGLFVNGPDLKVFTGTDLVFAGSFVWNPVSNEKLGLVGPTAIFQDGFVETLITDLGKL